jgi:hypothetical protein
MGVKSGRPSISRMSENVGASTSRNPKGLHGLYRDNVTFLYFTLTYHNLHATVPHYALRAADSVVKQSAKNTDALYCRLQDLANRVKALGDLTMSVELRRSCFRPEDRNSKFLRNWKRRLPDYATSHPRRERPSEQEHFGYNGYNFLTASANIASWRERLLPGVSSHHKTPHHHVLWH